jgi:tetratricopeptide (TPR) repeat protein
MEAVLHADVRNHKNKNNIAYVNIGTEEQQGAAKEMSSQGTCWSGVLGRGLYPPQLLGQVHLRKMTGDLHLRKSVSRFVFSFVGGGVTGCTMGTPSAEANLRWAVHEVFRYGKGTYSFIAAPGDDAPGGEGDRETTAELILDGVRSIGNIYLVEEALGRFGGTVKSSARQPVDSAFQLSPEESYLLSRIDGGPVSIEELCQISPVPYRKTLLAVYALVCAGVLDGGDPLFREPSAGIGKDGRDDVQGGLRSLASLGPTRPPLALHPSFARPRIREPELPVIRPLAPGSGVPGSGPDPADAVDEMDVARYHFEKGLEHYAREDFHGAVQLFGLAVRIDGERAEYHRHLALALSRNPLWGCKAEKALLRALELEPEHAETHYFLGRVYLDSGLQARAMARFRESLRLDPDLKPARLELAMINGAARAADRRPLAVTMLTRK